MMTADFFLPLGRSSFHLSALEATFIKTSKSFFCRQKIRLLFKDCTLMSNNVLSLVFFHSINGSDFFLSIAVFTVSCALHSDDSFGQLSDEMLLRRQKHFDLSNSRVLYHQSMTFAKVFKLFNNAIKGFSSTSFWQYWKHIPIPQFWFGFVFST